MGLGLLTRVARHARQHGEVPAHPQDERFATKAPMIRRTVSLTEQGKSAIASLVATVTGPDRPGIVSLLSDRAQGFGANWAGSRIATLAGQFAGLVHFEVPPANAEALATALGGLQRSGVQVVIARQEQIPVPAGRRAVKLELVGHDRLGIVSELSGSLARLGISIEDLHTEIVDGSTPAEHLFKVKALLVVPETVPKDELRRALEPFTKEMTIDLALGDEAARA
jgi:methionyl-tRNA formyltransferase